MALRVISRGIERASDLLKYLILGLEKEEMSRL